MREQGEWEVEFFEDDQGTEPVVDWLEGQLSDPAKQAAIAAIEEVLIPRGIDVCSTEWGKNLREGLYELRIRHSAAEIRQMFGSGPPERNDDGEEGDADAGDDSDEGVLLRIYFMTAGRKLILLVAGYDKERYGGGKREQKAIATARRRIREQKERERRQKAAKRKDR